MPSYLQYKSSDACDIATTLQGLNKFLINCNIALITEISLVAATSRECVVDDKTMRLGRNWSGLMSFFFRFSFSVFSQSASFFRDNFRLPLPFRCITDQFLYKYIQKEPSASRNDIPPCARESRIDSRAQKDVSRVRPARVLCLCLPSCFSSLFVLFFRHSEYVVPILTGLPFSSVKMKNQKAQDLRSSA